MLKSSTGISRLWRPKHFENTSIKLLGKRLFVLRPKTESIYFRLFFQ